MLLQIHDELIFEIDSKEVDAVVPKLMKIMKEVFAGKDTKQVPVEVDVKIGPNWLEMKPYSKNI